MHHVIIYFSNSKKFLLTLSASWRWQNLETALSDWELCLEVNMNWDKLQSKFAPSSKMSVSVSPQPSPAQPQPRQAKLGPS